MNNQNPQQNQNLKREQSKVLDSKRNLELTCDPTKTVIEGKLVSHDTEQITKEQMTSKSTEQKNGNEIDKKEKSKQRKTIEQQLADLDARRQMLIEKKRSQDAHEKIVFGTTVIAMLKDMKERDDENGSVICKSITDFMRNNEQPKKNAEIIKKIISEI